MKSPATQYRDIQNMRRTETRTKSELEFQRELDLERMFAKRRAEVAARAAKYARRTAPKKQDFWLTWAAMWAMSLGITAMVWFAVTLLLPIAWGVQ